MNVVAPRLAHRPRNRRLISSGLSFLSFSHFFRFFLLFYFFLLPTSTPADPCKNVKCNFGAECQDGRCLCPTDCPADLIEPVCVHSKISYISECEMRASACKQELDIDASSFIYGHCPHTVTTATPPDDMTEGSGDDSDDEDDYEAGTGGAGDVGDKKRLNDNKRGKDAGGGKRKKGDPPDDGIDGRDDDADDREDLSHPAPDLNEKDAFRSKLCRNTICPIGALCKLRKGAGGRDEAYCDCRQMCARVEELSLATAWIKSPVCGSNGLFYPNECRLRQDSCNKNTTIHILPAANCRSNASSFPSAEDNNNRPNDLLGESLP